MRSFYFTVLLILLTVLATPLARAYEPSAESCVHLLDQESSPTGPYLSLKSEIAPFSLDLPKTPFDPAAKEILDMLNADPNSISVMDKADAVKIDWASRLIQLTEYTKGLMGSVKSMALVPEEFRRRLAATFLSVAANLWKANDVHFSIHLNPPTEDARASFYLILEPKPEDANNLQSINALAIRFEHHNPGWHIAFDPSGLIERQTGAETDFQNKLLRIDPSMILAGNLKSIIGLHESRHLATYQSIIKGKLPTFPGATTNYGQNDLHSDYFNPTSVYTKDVLNDEPRAYLEGILQGLRDLRAPLIAADRNQVLKLLQDLSADYWFGLVTASANVKALDEAHRSAQNTPPSKIESNKWFGLLHIGVENLYTPEVYTSMPIGPEDMSISNKQKKKILVKNFLRMHNATRDLEGLLQITARVALMMQRQQNLVLTELMRQKLYLTLVHGARAIDRQETFSVEQATLYYNQLIKTGLTK